MATRNVSMQRSARTNTCPSGGRWSPIRPISQLRSNIMLAPSRCKDKKGKDKNKASIRRKHRDHTQVHRLPTAAAINTDRVPRPGQPPGRCRYNGWMQITLNGHSRNCGQGITITQLLHEAGYAGRRVAVEVNQEIVPRSQHDAHELRESDRVEIVHAIGGG